MKNNYENENNGQGGVLDCKKEGGEYIVKIKWKDGHINEHHFPERGIPIKEPDSEKILGVIPGDIALKILQNESPSLTQEEFSWLNYRENAVKINRNGD
jgi:hypothetical protein